MMTGKSHLRVSPTVCLLLDDDWEIPFESISDCVLVAARWWLGNPIWEYLGADMAGKWLSGCSVPGSTWCGSSGRQESPRCERDGRETSAQTQPSKHRLIPVQLHTSTAVCSISNSAELDSIEFPVSVLKSREFPLQNTTLHHPQSCNLLAVTWQCH